MPNQFETHTSDAGTTIHLKMNGELIENLIALDCIAITLFDIVFVYGVYEVYAENDSVLTLVLIFLVLPFIFYLHYEYRKNKRWAKNAEEIFFISKNNLHISKEWANSNMRCDSLKSLMIINKLSKFL